MIIDATDLIAGRLASYVAKQALLGNNINIINSENAVITGSKKNILERYLQKLHRGHPYSGPFFYRTEDRFLKRLIRGMLPYKQYKGRTAFERIKCYIGIPDKFKNEKISTIKEANISKLKNTKYLKIKDILSLIS